MDNEKHNISSSGERISPDTEVGTVVDIGDEGTRAFYGDSISDSYRMKSEIVNQCMEQIGMGRYGNLARKITFCRPRIFLTYKDRYQWELFVVSGFGYITDNL